ncbi:MAG: hypothetical protein WDO24_02600 [Pseudomonadota bacterium]
MTCGVRAGEIELDRAVGDRHRHLDPDRRVEIDAVIVEEIDVAEGALRQRLDGGPRHHLGAAQQLAEQDRQRVLAMAVGELANAPRADRAGGDLSVEIAHEHVRDADVLAQHAHQRVVHFAGIAQLDWRNPDALLEDLGGIGRHRAGRHAADILVMGHRPRIGDDAAAMEDRDDDGEIRQVRGHRNRDRSADRRRPPSWSRAGKVLRIMATAGIRVARCTGTAQAWASVVPSAVNRLADASSPSLTIGENELLSSVISISLAMPSSWWRTTSSVTGST